ncbi:MAG: hypothetical protein WD595_01670 [Waddliaceae bacterium]
MTFNSSPLHFASPLAIANDSPDNLPSSVTLRQKVTEIAKISFQILMIGAGFVLNPSLFAFGFLCSIAMPERIGELLSRVEGVYNAYKWQIGVSSIVACFFAPHVTLGLTSCLLGNFVGFKLMEYSGELDRVQERRQREFLQNARPTIDYFIQRMNKS